MTWMMYILYIIWVSYPSTRLAQSVERTPFKRVVVGSSPTSGEGLVDAFIKVATVGKGNRGIFHLTMVLLITGNHNED